MVAKPTGNPHGNPSDSFAGSFRFYQQEELDAWQKIHAVVPEDCLQFSSHYGSAGEAGALGATSEQNWKSLQSQNNIEELKSCVVVLFFFQPFFSQDRVNL